MRDFFLTCSARNLSEDVAAVSPSAEKLPRTSGADYNREGTGTARDRGGQRCD